MATAKEVTKLFMSWANRDGDLITNLKMQKLLYYAQAWHLVNYNKPLFPDPIQAWDLGPVIPSVYRDLREFRAGAIAYKSKGDEEKHFTREQLSYLKEFYAMFIKFSAHELVNMSHSETPWMKAHTQGANMEIRTSDMKTFYLDLYRRRKHQ
ncbi:MAG: DUF4065 domain-containing protein [Elusimicrobia bacterium]|nr:DUF4065 domain-containing protein [Elusimicrobiota bacterium]